MRAPRYLLSLAALLAILLVLPVAPSLTAGHGAAIAPMKIGAGTAREERARDAYGTQPLAFEMNEGQGDPAARFLAHGRGYTLALGPDALTLGLPTPLRFTFPGANPAPTMHAEQPLPGVVNSFLGDDPSRWRTGIPTAARVRYEDLYPGLDLVVYGTEDGAWEYDVIVAPGADPAAFSLSVDGTTGMTRDAATGDLVLTAAGEVRQHAPTIYQEVDGERRSVAGGYVLHDDGSVGFRVEEYDPTLPLVIDPTLVYSTFLGGSGSGSNGLDQGFGIAVDTSGNAFVTGVTTSADFPGTPPMTYHGSGDAFVTKLNASGALVYSTYVGGTGTDKGLAIAVDAGGNAYITGDTASTDFPVIGNAHNSGGHDAFIVKVSTAGLPIYSTYLGGSADDAGNGIAVDANGNAYVAGSTGSTDFPVTDGSISGGNEDAFVAKLDANGTRTYGTYLGGVGYESATAIAVDAGGNIYVAGSTDGHFPVTDGSTFGGGFNDAFITKLNGTGSRVYSTYLGGSGNDQGNGIAVDVGGNAYITGYTDSVNFPVTNGSALHGVGPTDTFVTKLNGSGVRAYSTYLGGSGSDDGTGIAVDTGGNAYVAGYTGSTDFPVTNGSTLSGATDIFIAKLDATGARVYGTYIGGSGGDQGDAIAVDTSGNAYVTGKTPSTDFPSTNGSIFGGGAYDAFVTKIAVTSSSPPPVPNPLPLPQPHPNPSGQPAPLPRPQSTVPIGAAPNPLPSRRP